MIRYMKYGPYICIAVVLAILFVLWAFWGGKNYEFVGLAPLAPDTCGSYTGSLYNWGNITPVAGYDPINGQNCVPQDVACRQSEDVSDESLSSISNYTPSQLITGVPLPVLDQSQPSNTISSVVDNTPTLPTQFRNIIPENSCPREDVEEPVNNDSLPVPEQLPYLEPFKPIVIDISAVSLNPLSQLNNLPQPNNLPQINRLPPPDNLPQPNNPTIYSRPTNQPRQTSQLNRRGRFISRGERMCCQTMERIYGVPFVSTWPDWLRNPETGEKLELDCFNDELKIAVEYNGEQHYKWPNHIHNQTYQQFINQVRRDELKVQLCDKNEVYLIVVPYNVSHERIPEFIMSHLPETIQKRLQEERILTNIPR
ncbi:Hypothetical protein HVR_LOCUS1104 [uncultured virus]|nr:Hypothetical protein HVR_LOCUS1104 [uncultured virus]